MAGETTLGTAQIPIRATLDHLDKDLAGARSKVDGALDKIGGSIQNLGKVALGIGAAFTAGMGAAAYAISGLASEGLKAYASYERLGMSLQSLVSKELIHTSGVEKIIVTGKALVQMTDAQRSKYNDLSGQLVILTGAHKAAESALNNAITKGKESQEEIAARRQKIIDLREKMDELRVKIAALDEQDGKYVTTIKKVIEGQLSMTDAMAQAGPKVADLLDWITKLAVQSPFNQADVASAFRMAMAYGFTTEEAKRLTQATIDFASGSGATGAAMGTISLALGQIKAKGKLAGQEVLQLVNAGLSVDAILAGAFGKSTEEIVKMREGGLIPANKAIEAITASLEKDFGGAAKRQAGTFSGLISSLQDIKEIGLREFFTGTFEEIQPYVSSFVDSLSSQEFMGKLRAIGETVGATIGRLVVVFKNIGDSTGTFVKNLQLGINPITALQILLTQLLPPEMVTTIMGIVAGVQSFLASIQPTIDQVAAWLAQNVNLQDVLIALGIAIAAVVIPAILSVVATIAPIVAAFVALVAVAALLRQAWTENWGGIRDTLTAFWEGTAKPALTQLWQWLQVNVPLAIQTLANFWTTVLQPALLAVWTWIQTVLFPALSDLWDWLAINVPAAIQVLSDFWNNTLMPALNAVWSFIQTYVVPLLSALAGLYLAVVSKETEALAGLWQKVLLPALTLVWKWIDQNIMPVFETLWKLIEDKVWPKVKQLAEVCYSLGETANGVANAFWAIVDAVKRAASAIANFKLPSWLTPGSPTPFELGLRGIRDEMGSLARMEMPRLTVGFERMQSTEFAPRGGGQAGAASGQQVNIYGLVLPGVQDRQGLLEQLQAYT